MEKAPAPPQIIKGNSSWLDVINAREKNLPNYAYKLADSQGKFSSNSYGVDTNFDSEPVINTEEMSVMFPFASGLRRDGVGDLLEISGINTERHQKNPLILFDHSKQCALPIATARDPLTKEYCVYLDADNKVATCKAFFYTNRQSGQTPGTNVTGTTQFEHEVFCAQIFDMLVKGLIRGGSIGYQVQKALRLDADYTTGTPPGLHLLQILMLEASIVVTPASMDTVLKSLECNGRFCGYPLSPILRKSLEPYAPDKKAFMAYGMETKSYPDNDPYIKWDKSKNQWLLYNVDENLNYMSPVVMPGKEWESSDALTERAAKIVGVKPNEIQIKSMDEKTATLSISKQTIGGREKYVATLEAGAARIWEGSGNTEQEVREPADNAASYLGVKIKSMEDTNAQCGCNAKAISANKPFKLITNAEAGFKVGDIDNFPASMHGAKIRGEIISITPMFGNNKVQLEIMPLDDGKALTKGLRYIVRQSQGNKWQVWDTVENKQPTGAGYMLTPHKDDAEATAERLNGHPNEKALSSLNETTGGALVGSPKQKAVVSSDDEVNSSDDVIDDPSNEDLRKKKSIGFKGSLMGAPDQQEEMMSAKTIKLKSIRAKYSKKMKKDYEMEEVDQKQIKMKSLRMKYSKKAVHPVTGEKLRGGMTADARRRDTEESDKEYIANKQKKEREAKEGKKHFSGLSEMQTYNDAVMTVLQEISPDHAIHLANHGIAGQWWADISALKTTGYTPEQAAEEIAKKPMREAQVERDRLMNPLETSDITQPKKSPIAKKKSLPNSSVKAADISGSTSFKVVTIPDRFQDDEFWVIDQTGKKIVGPYVDQRDAVEMKRELDRRKGKSIKTMGPNPNAPSPLSKTNIPPSKWKPGVGAVGVNDDKRIKDLRAKYGKKSVLNQVGVKSIYIMDDKGRYWDISSEEWVRNIVEASEFNSPQEAEKASRRLVVETDATGVKVVTKSLPSSSSKILKHEGYKWVLYSHHGAVLGRHPSKESALAQERAIEANKSIVKEKSQQGSKSLLAPQSKVHNRSQNITRPDNTSPQKISGNGNKGIVPNSHLKSIRIKYRNKLIRGFADVRLSFDTSSLTLEQQHNLYNEINSAGHGMPTRAGWSTDDPPQLVRPLKEAVYNLTIQPDQQVDEIIHGVSSIARKHGAKFLGGRKSLK